MECWLRRGMNALRDMEKICGYDAPLASALKAMLDAESRVDQSLTRFNLLYPDRGDAISHNILRLAYAPARSRAS